MRLLAPGRRSAVTLLFLLSTLSTIGVSGCRRPHGKGAVAVDTVLKTWNEAGFQSDTVLSVEPGAWSAAVCSQGLVAGLHVLLCEYDNDQTLTLGEQKVMEDWTAESVATGAVVHASNTLLAVADPEQVDPSGRTIARLIQSFRLVR